MGTITINSVELLLPAVDDGNSLTATSGAVMVKSLYSDEFASALDSVHLTASNIFGAPDTEVGTAVESSGVVAFSVTRAGGVNARKSLITTLTFNTATAISEMNNIVMAASEFGHVRLQYYVDNNNHAYMSRRFAAGAQRITWQLVVGGVSVEVMNFASSVADVIMKIEFDGTDFHGFYDIGGGFVELSSAASHAKSIGTPFRIGWDAHARTNNTTRSADLNYLRLTGTGVFWDTKSDSSAIKDTFNTQNATEGAGSTIQFGSAVFTEGANMTYDIKIGTAGFINGRTSAQIIALGDQVTDDGTFQLRAVYGGGTSQASWTSLSVPTVAGGGVHMLIRGTHTNIGNALINAPMIAGVA